MASKRTARTPSKKGRPEWASDFLEKLDEHGGEVSVAAAKAGIGRRTAYDLRDRDEDFAKEWAATVRTAKIAMRERLAVGSLSRAVEGWEEPVFHNGELCGYKRRFSPTLEMFHLRAAFPKEFNIPHGDPNAGAGDSAERTAGLIRDLVNGLLAAVPQAPEEET